MKISLPDEFVVLEAGGVERQVGHQVVDLILNNGSKIFQSI